MWPTIRLLLSLALLAACAACGDDADPPADVGPDLADATPDLVVDAAPDLADAGVDLPAADLLPADLAPDTADAGVADAALNAACAAPQLLTLSSGKVSVSGNTAGAPNEHDKQITCGSAYDFDGAQVYYQLSLKAKTYVITLAPVSATFDASLYLFSTAASCAPKAINAACGGSGGVHAEHAGAGKAEVITFSPAAAGDVIIAVDSWQAGGAGPFTLSIEEAAKPQNDSCKGAASLAFSGGQLELTGQTFTAKSDVQLTAADCTGHTTDGPDLFYKVKLSAGATYRFRLDGNKGWNEALYLFGSCSKPAGTCSDGMGADVSTSSAEELTFEPTVDATYYLGVAGRGAKDAGGFLLSAAEYKKPQNNSCAAASALTLKSGKGAASGHTFGATDTLDLPPGGCTGTDTEGGDVWHKVTLTAGTTYRFKLTPDSGFNAALYLLSGCASPATSCVAGADTFSAGGGEQLIYKPTKSGTYHVAVDSRHKPDDTYAEGSYTLELETVTPPQNSACATPQVVALAGLTVVQGDTTLASDEFPALNCGNSVGPWPGRQLYYRVNLLGGVRYTAELKASFDSALYAFPAGTACTQKAVDAACKSPTPTDPDNVYNADLVSKSGEQIKIKPASIGDWILVVDAWDPTAYGTFDLKFSWK